MTIPNIDGGLPQQLADEFSRLIRDSLTVDQMTEVLRRNKTTAVGECASGRLQRLFCRAANRRTVTTGTALPGDFAAL